MKVRITLYSVLMLFLYLFSCVFIPFSVNGTSPQYVLAGVVCVALFENEKAGALLGLIFGLLADFSSGGLFGVIAVIYAATGYFTGVNSSKKIKLNIVSAIAVCSAVIAAQDLLKDLYYCFMDDISFFVPLYTVTLPKIIITLPVVVVVYFAVRGIYTCRLWRNIDEEY